MGPTCHSLVFSVRKYFKKKKKRAESHMSVREFLSLSLFFFYKI